MNWFFFNAKGENAAEFEEMCKAFTEETGIPTKPFSIGSGQDSDEMLRAQMNSRKSTGNLYFGSFKSPAGMERKRSCFGPDNG